MIYKLAFMLKDENGEYTEDLGGVWSTFPIPVPVVDEEIAIHNAGGFIVEEALKAYTVTHVEGYGDIDNPEDCSSLTIIRCRKVKD